MGDQPDARPLPTQDDREKRGHTHSCLEKVSNPRSQCSSSRRQDVPQTARPMTTSVVTYIVIERYVKWIHDTTA